MTAERLHFAYNLGSPASEEPPVIFGDRIARKERSPLRRPPTRKVTRGTYLRASGGGGARSNNSRVGWRAADWRWRQGSTECRRSSGRPAPRPRRAPAAFRACARRRRRHRPRPRYTPHSTYSTSTITITHFSNPFDDSFWHDTEQYQILAYNLYH